jgi:cupin fold WbuC family metalloprotein
MKSNILSASGFTTYRRADLCRLTDSAAAASTRRDRILMHGSHKDTIQEMIVALMSDSVVRPHKHPNGSESYYILSGSMEVLWGDSPGHMYHRVKLDSECHDGVLGLRLDKNIWHSTRALTKCAVFLEVGVGPFNESKTVYDDMSHDEYTAG